MNFRDNLNVMRNNYKNNPIKGMKLPAPEWLTEEDGMYRIYKNQNIIYKYGTVYYALVVQANSNLYDPDSRLICPADMTYSTHPDMPDHLYELRKINERIFSYKDEDSVKIPENYRRVSWLVTNEMSRGGIDFYSHFSDPLNITVDDFMEFHKDYSKTDPDRFNIRMTDIMVIKEHLPEYQFSSPVYPILAVPEKCDAVIILPKEYWTEEFTEWYLMRNL